MAFKYGDKLGEVYAPGYFLAHEECMRKTKTISATGISADADGHKHVKAGTLYTDSNSNVIGFLYEDVDVTAGDMPGSVVTKGVVYEDKLPAELSSANKNTLKGLGFVFINSPTVTRPDDPQT